MVDDDAQLLPSKEKEHLFSRLIVIVNQYQSVFDKPDYFTFILYCCALNFYMPRMIVENVVYNGV